MRSRLLVVPLVLILGAVWLMFQWSGATSAPAVHLLGGDGRLGVLVTAGTQRVLVVDSGDPEALDGALRLPSHPGFGGIDLAIVTGEASQATSLPSAKQYIYLSSDGEGLEIELSDGVTLQIETRPWKSQPNGAWRVSIEYRNSKIAFVSDAAVIRQFDWADLPEALLLHKGSDLTLPADLLPQLYAFPSAGVDYDNLRTLLNQQPGVQYLFSVRNGQEVKLSLTADGIAVSDQPISG